MKSKANQLKNNSNCIIYAKQKNSISEEDCVGDEAFPLTTQNEINKINQFDYSLQIKSKDQSNISNLNDL